MRGGLVPAPTASMWGIVRTFQGATRSKTPMSANADPGDVPIRASPPADALRLVLETALDAVVVMRNDGIVADWNDQAVKVFGWAREEAVGRAMADLIIPERYRVAHKNGLERYLSSGEATVLGRRIEVSGIRKKWRGVSRRTVDCPDPG
jgi:PAS domain S-box-containing protein